MEDRARRRPHRLTEATLDAQTAHPHVRPVLDVHDEDRAAARDAAAAFLALYSHLRRIDAIMSQYMHARPRVRASSVPAPHLHVRWQRCKKESGHELAEMARLRLAMPPFFARMASALTVACPAGPVEIAATIHPPGLPAELNLFAVLPGGSVIIPYAGFRNQIAIPVIAPDRDPAALEDRFARLVAVLRRSATMARPEPEAVLWSVEFRSVKPLRHIVYARSADEAEALSAARWEEDRWLIATPAARRPVCVQRLPAPPEGMARFLRTAAPPAPADKAQVEP